MNHKLIQFRTHGLQHGGFSLIELLVSMTIFIVVLTIASGALLTLVDSNIKAQNNKLAMSNLAFVLQSMTREIRTGTNWFCNGKNSVDGHINGQGSAPDSEKFPKTNDDTRDCGVGTDRFISIVETGGSLTDPAGPVDDIGDCGGGSTGSNRVTFYRAVDSNSIGRVYRLLGNCAGGPNFPRDAVPITPPEINITAFRLEVVGTDTLRDGNRLQPRATMVLEGETVGVSGAAGLLDTSFTVQTTVTQRLLDV